MTIGIDPSGRAFRWKVDNSGTVGMDYLVMGCPPMPGDTDEVTLWEDSFAFRNQVCTQPNPVEGITADLITIGMSWKKLYGNTTQDYSKAAKEIVNSIRVGSRCRPQPSLATAFAIPNLLSEDAQDALLKALRLGGYSNPVLLWRPIAIMFYWLHIQEVSSITVFEKNRNSHVWVLDFDAPRLELTRLSWKPHKSDKKWIAPVRSYPSRNHPNGLGSQSVAWKEIFTTIPEQCRRQLSLGQIAPDVQRVLESGVSSFDVWVCNSHRWEKVAVERPQKLSQTCGDTLENELLNLLAYEHMQPPSRNDIILVHGWLPHLYSSDFTEIIKALWEVNDVRVMPSEAVVLGAQFFADRYSGNLPTYYDQLPEYQLWTRNGWRTLVNQNEAVEPGHPWRLSDPTLQDAFSIGQHRSDLSFLVKRNPVANPESDYARRLKVPLTQMAMAEIPLHLDITVRPAQGSAEFVVNAGNNEHPFILDARTQTQTAVLSYGLSIADTPLGRGTTTQEPQHKGYLEAQPIIGRIYDNPVANIGMLQLLVDHCNDLEMAPAFNAVVASVQKYRTDHPALHHFANIPGCILQALERWGYNINPQLNQPTRGLFGTKIVENAAISELSIRLSNHLWEGMPLPANNGPRNFWSKRQNYCHVFASDTYKNFIRNILRNSNQQFASWSEAYASGYVLGEQPDDARLLAEYSIARNFDIATNGYPEKHFWAFFRMLCWHPEVRLETDFIRRYLEALLGFVNQSPLLNQQPIPNGLVIIYQQTRRYICFAILFALRVRETSGCELFLLKEEDVNLRNTLVASLSTGGQLADVLFPPTMLAGIAGVAGTFSAYVRRFILRQDTVEDRELGSSIATSK